MELTATVTDGNVTTAMPITFTFDESGLLTSPTSQALDLTYTNTGGGAATMTDFSNMFQFTGNSALLDLNSNGNASGFLDSINFAETGEVIAFFEWNCTYDLQAAHRHRD